MPQRRAGKGRRKRSRSRPHTEAFRPHHATSVPREAELDAALDATDECDEPITTVMLRHIPCRYTQSTLLGEVDQIGFEGTYDFFYLPMDMRNKTSVGYAFINFLDAPTAQRFIGMMQDYRFQRHPSDKIPEVSAAHLQGLERNIEHFAHSAVLKARDPKYRPIVLQCGLKRDFVTLAAELAFKRAGTAAPCSDVQVRCNRRRMPVAATPPVHNAIVLNPMAVEFVPKSSIPNAVDEQVSSKTNSTSDFDLEVSMNPSAEEFVPAAAEGPLADPGPPPQARCGGSKTSSINMIAFQEARRELEVVLAGLLMQRSDSVRQFQLDCEIASEQFQRDHSEAAAAAAVLHAQCQQPWMQLDSDSDEDSVTEPSRLGLRAAPPGLQRANWVEEAFRALIDDLPRLPCTRTAPSVRVCGFTRPSSSMSGEAVFDDSTCHSRQFEGSWVAEALAALVRGTSTPPRQRLAGPPLRLDQLSPQSGTSLASGAWVPGNWVTDTLNALVSGSMAPTATTTSDKGSNEEFVASSSSSGSETGGGKRNWVADAFFKSLTAGQATPALSTERSPEIGIGTEPGPEQRSWIAEAFWALASSTGAKKSRAAADANLGTELSPPASPPSSPKNLTPRSVGDALHRLQSLGGWAWVAFA